MYKKQKLKDLKLLRLTAVSTLPNESAENKIAKARAEISNTDVDDEEYNAEWYREMGLKVPEHLQDEGNKSSAFIELNEEDFEEFYNYTVVPLDQILFCTDKEFGGSVLYMKEDFQIELLQSAQEVEMQIRYLNQNILQRWIQKLEKKFRGI